MSLTYARQFIHDVFAEAFDKEKYRLFIRNLLNELDESSDRQTHWTHQYVKDAYKPGVEKFERLATYTDENGDKIDVLIVYLKKETGIHRARTFQRNFIADYLTRGHGENKEAVLAAFVSPDPTDWRFSLIRLEYVTEKNEKGVVAAREKLTPARRYSFLVGSNESSHTAQSQLVEILSDTENNPTLAQLEEAFNVERVTKEFFECYKTLVFNLQEEVESTAKKDKVVAAEFKAKKINTLDFAKKLMGQIVFLYFIQKKGWLGVKKGADWGTGPQNFLRQLFAGGYSEYENFFNDILEHLFYDTLATDRGHGAWCKHFKCRIPFLNGGLFEPLDDYDWQKTEIIIPNVLFSNDDKSKQGDVGTGILDVFDRYNFTVNESEPLEKEVAIDPEMLGKVFEELLGVSERKSKGSFYTPREIVHYMCQESLVNYLDTSINTQQKSLVPEKARQTKMFDAPEPEQGALQSQAYEEIVPRTDIETLIHLGERASDFEAARKSGTKSYSAELPKAIEKHARLIDEKLRDITVCDPAIGSGAFPVGMMTEIVRVRSTLTPYFNDISERTPYHFKRHVIQDCLYGVDIDPGAVEIAKLRLWLSLVVDEEDVKQIKPLPNLDYKIVGGNSLLGVEKDLFNLEAYNQLEKLKPLYFDETDHDKKAEIKADIDKLIHDLTNGKDVFDFEIYFSEVFHGNGGFDVVIANPPYVQIKGIPVLERRIYESLYKFASGRFNLFYLFIEHCEVLLKKGGVASFIVPDRLLLNTQCKPIRIWLLDENLLREIVTFGDQVFQAVVDSILLTFVRQRQKPRHVRVKRKCAQQDITTAQAIHIPVTYFELSPSSQFDTNYSSQKHDLLRKIITRMITLSTISDTKDGIIQSKIGDKLFLSKKSNPDCKQLLVGENVTRYSINYAGRWVDYRPEEMKILEKARNGGGLRLRDRSIFERSKILTRQTADELIAAYDHDKYYYANTLHGTAITSNNYHPHYILGVLNSRITTWYYRSNTDEKGKVFAQIKIELLRKLPIPKAEGQEQQPIVSLVEDILSKRKDNPDADVANIEKQIDDLVYELYGLTKEEIAIVEGHTQ